MSTSTIQAPPAPADAGTDRSPEEAAARAATVKLLREIVEYQQRLKRLAERRDPRERYLIRAYRRSIRVRRELLASLPEPVDRSTPDPWRPEARTER